MADGTEAVWKGWGDGGDLGRGEGRLSQAKRGYGSGYVGRREGGGLSEKRRPMMGESGEGAVRRRGVVRRWREGSLRIEEGCT